MKALLACFLASVSLQYGYLYAENTDGVDVEDVNDHEDDEDELDNEENEDKNSDTNVKENKNIDLKIANNSTALSANLSHVARVKEDKKNERKVNKDGKKKPDPKKELNDRFAKVTNISASINATIEELEVHMNNERFDARNRSFFRKLYAEFSTIADYIKEFNKKSTDVDILLAYINIAVDDIYFVTSESSTVGISDIAKRTISEILFKTSDGKIVLEWLKEISDVKMQMN